MITGSESPSPTVSPLSERACLDLVSEAQLGRVAWRASDTVQILPITYILYEGRIYFRTSPDSILSELLLPTQVALEVDDLDARSRTGRSVVVHGQSGAVAEPDEVTRLLAFDPVPWAPGHRRLFIQITPDQVTGRVVSRERG